jgi:hypothetical protein
MMLLISSSVTTIGGLELLGLRLPNLPFDGALLDGVVTVSPFGLLERSQST